jgi:YggT family protein
MQLIFRFLAAAAGLYSLLIFIRIIISWFGDNFSGRPVDLLFRITDPYLDWWRRALNLRFGFIDLSPLAAVAFLSMFQSILGALSRFDRVTFGNILSIVLLSAWSIASFVLWFCALVIILRFIAYMTNRNIYSPFWRAVDTISQPILYRINRIFFGRRIPGYLKGIFVSIIALVVLWIAGRFIVMFLARLFSGLPF